jgi:tetratricopeptide (TPR) repeat protein
LTIANPCYLFSKYLKGIAMRLLAALALTALPFASFAAGSDDTEPPTPTATTTECVEGQVWDEKTKACIVPEDAMLDDDQRFDAVRELAYAGRTDDALRVLAAMTEGDTDRVLTYTGFLNRQAGNWEAGLAAYDRALKQNPDNILARSYYGQALVMMNEIELASLQLNEIRTRGGAGTWAETALATAITTGETATY